ncbi:MAG: hypothetical protein CMG66_04860 [Candidatus Marinimicrobia bacterium]|nr:hypothetical protein [Candidatus Neomarinimicrobiota bacterium]|tara:strand:- start:28177 stop:28653 length:477 start_codon:yes stop_codon:yes gene_type:complete
MINFINPIELSILLFIILISGFGLKNGFIIELKKIINLSLSLFLSSMIVKYILGIYPQSDMIIVILYTLFFLCLILLIGFFSDLTIEYSSQFSIPYGIDKLLGGLLAILKSLILISTLLFFIKLLPMPSNIINNFFLKANQGSTLFAICENLQAFIIN